MGTKRRTRDILRDFKLDDEDEEDDEVVVEIDSGNHSLHGGNKSKIGV